MEDIILQIYFYTLLSFSGILILWTGANQLKLVKKKPNPKSLLISTIGIILLVVYVLIRGL